MHELKETEKGVEHMCREMEQIYHEGEKNGEEKGERKAKKDAALSMAEDGMSVEKIARLIKVSEVEVRKWLDESVCFTK